MFGMAKLKLMDPKSYKLKRMTYDTKIASKHKTATPILNGKWKSFKL
jgi:hypothetical protein